MPAEQQTNITVNANVQPFTQAMQQATTAANQFQTAVGQMSNSTQQTQSQVTVTAQSFAKLAAALDPALRSANQYAAAEKQITAAVAAGLATQEQANKLLDLANEKYKTLSYQAQQAAKAQADAAQKNATQAKAAYDQLVASTNPLVRQQQEQAKAQATVNNALNAGKVSAIGAIGAMQQWQNAQKAASTESVKLTGATKLTAQQLFVFEAQIRQFADQVMSGGGIFRPLAMQAPVAIESLGGVSNALGLLRRNLGTILTVGGIAALGAGLVELAVSAERNQRSINSLSNGLQKYGGDFTANAQLINGAAKEMAATTSIGTQEARDSMAILASAPGFKMTKDNLESVTKTAMDMAASMGISTQQAATFITKIFADPVAAALQGVQDHIAGFDTNFVASIEDMVRQGKQVDAINTVFNRFAASVKGSAENVTPLQRALHDLSEAFTQLGNNANGAGKGIGTGLTNGLAGAIDDLTILVKWLGDTSAALERLGISGKTQIEVVAGVLTAQLIPGVRSAEAALVRMAAVQFGTLIANLANVVVSMNAVTTAANQAAIATTLSKVPYVGGAIALGIGAYNLATTQSNVNLSTLPKDSPLWGKVPPELQLNFPNSPLSLQSGPVSFAAPSTAALGQAVDVAQGFAGKTGTDLNAWLNQNGAQIDAAKSAWCAAFVNSALASVGIQGSGSNVATSFLNWGQQHQTAQRGDVVVQSRGLAAGTPGGHVGLATGNTRVGPDGQLMVEMVSGNVGGGQGYTGPNMVATNWVPASSVQIRGASAAAANAQPTPGVTGVTGPAGAVPPTSALQTLLEKTPTQGVTLDETQRQLHQLLDTTNQFIASGKYVGDDLDKLTQHARDLSKAIYTTVDPLTQLNREQQNQLNVDNELNPAQQKVIEAQQAYTQTMRTQMGVEPTVEQLEKVRIGTLNLLAAGYRSQVSAAEQSAASENRIANAWENGAAAANHAMNAEKARQQIVGNSPTIDAAQAAAIALVTKKLDDQTASANRAMLSQQKLQDASTNRILDVQESTLGASAQVQAAALAGAQTREQLRNRGIDLESQEAKDAISRSQALGARTVNVDREKAAWQEVNQVASQAIDDIGIGLATALETGKWTDFGNVAKKVLQDISTEFLKLALLNPIKNMLIPGSNAPDLFSLFNNTGGSAANNLSGNMMGGSSSGSGGFNPGGLLGSLGSMLFGKSGLFGSQGVLFGTGGLFGSGAASTYAGAALDLSSIEASASSFAATLPAASAADSLLMTGIYHRGGIVGDTTPTRYMPMRAWSGAPRLHRGMVTPLSVLPQFANDEYPAVLQRNEAVLTPAQQRFVAAKMRTGSDRPIVINPQITVHTPDADSFRKSKNQVTTELARSIAIAAKRM